MLRNRNVLLVLKLFTLQAPLRKSGTSFDFDSSLTSVNAIKKYVIISSVLPPVLMGFVYPLPELCLSIVPSRDIASGLDSIRPLHSPQPVDCWEILK